MASKKKGKKNLYFELADGTRYRVVGEDGKYWFCEDAEGRKTQFRKAAARGVIVETPRSTADADTFPQGKAEKEG